MNYMNSAVLSEMLKKKSTNKRGTWQVILHDDNKITFDHVIDCLMDVCGHNQFQAHQCALITHNKKRCSIFVDSHNSCQVTADLLNKLKLTVSIEKHEKHS